MKLLRSIVIPVFFAALVFGCTPDPVYPAEPSLVFKEYIQSSGSDSLQVVFSFTDGDGDIGISPLDTDSNMVLYLYEKNAAGQWVPILNTQTPPPDTLDSLYFPYRIPKLVAGQVGLEGDIYLHVNKTLLLAAGYDTLQFGAFLLDQSDNKSPYVRTPEVALIP